MSDDLAALVRSLSGRAIPASRGAGPAGVGAVAPLTTDEDWRVRELAAACLLELGGPAVLAPLAARLGDDAPQVRALALRGLSAHGDCSVAPALLAFVDGATAPGATLDERRHAVFGVGLHGAALPRGELRARWEAEQPAALAEAWLVALAKLGEADARRRVLAELAPGASRARLRTWLLSYGFYLHEPFLLPALRELCDRGDELVFLGHGEAPEVMRVCDGAAGLAASILDLPAVRRPIPPVLRDGELAAVRSALRR